MAIPGLTYRIEKESSLTHLEMDNNFRSVIYSGSIHDSGTTLHLHYDTAVEDKIIIPLGAASAGFTILNNTNDNVLTATGQTATLQGESGLKFSSPNSLLTLIGRASIDDGFGNVILGAGAGDNLTSGDGVKNVLVGRDSGTIVDGNRNVAVGYRSLFSADGLDDSVAIGELAFSTLISGANNVALGRQAGSTLTAGSGNIYIGNGAGPVFSSTQSNKLYINNQASNVPLILGDFSTGTVVFNSTVSASYFSGSYYGDGSNLTGLTATSEWDGTRDGDGEITGSFTVSGSNVIVDFTAVEAISGSIFSGSFYGDGSNLTGITADSFPYTGSARISGSLRVDGPAQITGSFTVSGSSPEIYLKGDTYIDDNIRIKNIAERAFGIGVKALNESNANEGIAIGFESGVRARSNSTLIGNYTGYNAGNSSTFVGQGAGATIAGKYNTAIGANTLQGQEGKGDKNTALGYDAGNAILSGNRNTAIGYQSLYNHPDGNHNTAIGYQALFYLDSKFDNNTAIGSNAGELAKGDGNVFIGYKAGPQSTGTVNLNDKLYINNEQSNTPLIKGDFNLGSVTINSQVTASKFLGTYYGDGSNLSGLEWDGSHDGNANITGSFIVSSSTAVVDFTNTAAISGSNFSGSFAGDGSNLTGVASEWDGSHNGNASITGSLIVSGALDIADTVTISSTGYPGGPGVELIHVSKTGVTGNTVIKVFDTTSTGYTGFKADYSTSNSSFSESRTGFLMGAWNTSSSTQIVDKHTLSLGVTNSTEFTLVKSANQATLTIEPANGFYSYDVNIIITAFKKQV